LGCALVVGASGVARFRLSAAPKSLLETVDFSDGAVLTFGIQGAFRFSEDLREFGTTTYFAFFGDRRSHEVDQCG
jgi:hypothetical protein